MYEGKNGSIEHSNGNKTVPEKVATHVQRMDRNRTPNKLYNIDQKDEGTLQAQEEMEGPTSF